MKYCHSFFFDRRRKFELTFDISILTFEKHKNIKIIAHKVHQLKTLLNNLIRHFLKQSTINCWKYFLSSILASPDSDFAPGVFTMSPGQPELPVECGETRQTPWSQPRTPDTVHTLHTDSNWVTEYIRSSEVVRYYQKRIGWDFQVISGKTTNENNIKSKSTNNRILQRENWTHVEM